MAINVAIPKEITEYEEKIMFGLSLRKLVCFVIAVLLAIGTYFICTKVFELSMDLTSYIIIIEALPLMAIGFVKKDGMEFEKYFALLIRHKSGRKQYKYEPELLIDYLNTEERKSKYAWIFEEENSSNGAKLTRKEQKARTRIKEYKVFKITKKERKNKSKETLRKIKAAKQEYRTAKRRAKKAAKELSRSKKRAAAS